MIEDGPRTFLGPARFLRYIKGPDHWHEVGETGEPAFENSWVNFGGGLQVARFTKNASGIVHIEGTVKNGTVATDSTGVIFTLPAGYRPSLALIIDTISNGALGRIDVGTSGIVRAHTGNNAYFSIHCSFYPN